MEQNQITNRIFRKVREGKKKGGRPKNKGLEAVSEDLRNTGIQDWKEGTRSKKHGEKWSEILKTRMRKSKPKRRGPARSATLAYI